MPRIQAFVDSLSMMAATTGLELVAAEDEEEEKEELLVVVAVKEEVKTVSRDSSSCMRVDSCW